MNWFDQIVSSEIVYRLGWTVIHSLWQGLALAVILASALLLIPKRMNNIRYSCSCLALLAMFAAFCTTASLIPPKTNAQPSANPWIAKPTLPINTPTTLTTTAPNPPDTSPAKPTATAIATQTPATTPSWQTQIAKTLSPWIGYVSFAWLIGVFAMSIWNLGGFIAVRRLRLIGTWPAPDQLTETLKHLADKFSIRRTVKLLQSTVVKTPMTIGWLKPVILIPASVLSELSTEQIEAIIAHELAHIRRYDYLINLLQTLAETLLFHHPAVWWISNKIRIEREYCCDNAVIELTSDQVNYAKALTSIAEMKNALPQLAVAASGGSLLSRIRRILGTDGESSLLRNRSAGWAIIALVVVIAAFAVGLGLNNDNLLAVPHKYGATEDTGQYKTLQNMIGTWTVNSEKSTGQGNVIKIEIKPDATCLRYESANDDSKIFYDRIQLKKDKLTVSGYWGKQSFDLKLEQNKMTWTEEFTILVFERSGKDQTDSITVADVLGTWQMVSFVGKNDDNIDSMDLTFNADGSWHSVAKGPEGSDFVDDDKGTYKIQDGRLTFDEHPDINLSVDGKRLTILEDGTKVIFEKKPTVTTNPQALIGKWKCDDVSQVEAKRVDSLTLEFITDNSGRSSEIGFDGKELNSEAFEYKVEGNTISGKGPDPDDQWEPIQWRIENDILFLNDKDHAYKYKRLDTPDKALPKPTASADDDITQYVGSWRSQEAWADGVKSDNIVNLDLNADGTCSFLVTIDGVHHTDSATFLVKGNRIIFEGNEEMDPSIIAILEGDTLTISGDGDKVVLKKYDPGMITADQRFIGSWSTTKVPDLASVSLTAIFLDLNADATFTLHTEGPDSIEPVTGNYTTDGNTLKLLPEIKIPFIKSIRYDKATIRLSIGSAAAVLNKTVPNPFEGSEHPMFRAMLTSTESQSGQIWLDLDTGKSVTTDQWERMSQPDKSMYELTLEKGQISIRIQLTLASNSAKMLPIRMGGDFARAGSDALKLLPSLKQSKLRTTDYKGGIFLAVLTDRGRLAVVEMMTPTATDETPLGWSLGEIIEANNGKVQIKIIKTDKLQNHVLMPKKHRITLPDIDKQPIILDLASGEIITVPKEVSQDDGTSAAYLKNLKKGDIGFDQSLAVLRGGTASIFDGQKATPLTFVKMEELNIKIYPLQSIPCRFLITTAQGKQFDVKAIAETKDDGLEIEYTPLTEKVPLPDETEYGSSNPLHTSARAAKLKTQLGTIKMAVDMYRLDYGKWPDLDNGWQALTAKEGTGPYLKEKPVNPYTRGSKVTLDATGDWQWDPDQGRIKAVVPLTATKAKELGFNIETQVVPADTDKIASPVHVVAQWMALAIAAKDDDAQKLVAKGKTCQAKAMREIPNANSIKLMHAFANDRAALVITSEITDDFQNAGVMVFLLVKQEQRWLLEDIDFESADRTEGIIEGFQNHPGVERLTIESPDQADYKVKPGDTLSKISEQMLGTPDRYKDIMKLNNLENAKQLQAGMILKLPKDSSQKPWQYELPAVIGNLNEPGLTRYLRMQVVLNIPSLTDPAKETSLIKSKESILRDSLNEYISSLTLAQAMGQKNQAQMKEEICQRFNEVLYPQTDGHITNILFKEFVAQQ